jgi:hypothetical protein
MEPDEVIAQELHKANVAWKEARERTDAELRAAVAAARAAGWSWERIGTELGVGWSAAKQRFARWMPQ